MAEAASRKIRWIHVATSQVNCQSSTLKSRHQQFYKVINTYKICKFTDKKSTRPKTFLIRIITKIIRIKKEHLLRVKRMLNIESIVPLLPKKPNKHTRPYSICLCEGRKDKRDDRRWSLRW